LHESSLIHSCLHLNSFASRSAREKEVHQVEPGDDIRRSASHHTAQPALATLLPCGIGRPPGELREGVQRPDVGGITPQHAVDFAVRVGLPTGLLVHAGQHQPDVSVGGIERRGTAELGFGVAIASLPQIYEAEVRITEGLIRGECHHLTELHLGTGKLILLQVGQSPGPGRERRVAPRLVPSPTRRRAPTRQQQQADDPDVPRRHSLLLRQFGGR